MTTFGKIRFVLSGIALAGFASNCSSFGAVPSDAAPLDGGGDGANGDERTPVTGQPPPGCDATADPKDAPSCLDNSFAVFVDVNRGSDAQAGTRESLLKSISAALGKLDGRARLYVAAGTYTEHVTLTSAVSLYGGFAGPNWSYSGDKANVVPTDAGFAITVRDVGSPLVVTDLSFTAQPGDATSPSSIAGFLANSNVTFQRATLTAANAADGVDAVNLEPFSPAVAPDGTAGGAGGAATPNPMCPTSIGGAGGKDLANGSNGVVAVVPIYPTGYDGVGGVVGMSCPMGGNGNGGSYGGEGTAGSGASTLGALTADGWTTSRGGPGGKGGNGQGAGGGRPGTSPNAGSAGGPGGCGGAAGTEGTGGGSSLALASYNSTVVLLKTTLVAADAGRGGNGAKGQTGQRGGGPGAVSTFNACIGGTGGVGGSGGGGGGGAGGISAGVLYKGAAPSINGTMTAAVDTIQMVTLGALGAAGMKGLGGDAAVANSRAGAAGNDGVPGQARAVLLAP